jgi:hypothetical protein
VTDRHREKPLSLRLGPDRQRLESLARDTGQPVRRIAAEAIREYLDKHAAETGDKPSPDRRPLRPQGLYRQLQQGRQS